MEAESIEQLIKHSSQNYPVTVLWQSFYDSTAYNTTRITVAGRNCSGEELTFVRWRESEFLDFTITKTLIVYYKTIQALRKSRLIVADPYLLGYAGSE